MSELPKQCEPCKAGMPAISEPKARELAQEHIPEWTLEFPRLRRTFVLPHFRKALAFTNRIGMLAEEEGHHPEFHLTGFNKVTLELWTHAIEGLSENDFVLAKKIDALWRHDTR